MWRRIIQNSAFSRGLWTGSVIAVILLLLWIARLFSPAQLSLTNIYYAPKATSDTIVLLTIDDASLQAYGRSPSLWDRTIYADLVGFLQAGGARVVAFDLLFTEPAEGDEAFVEAMQNARQSDVRTRFVLVGAGVGIPAIEPADDALPPRLVYNNVLNPLPTLAQEADYIAYVNAFPDVDGVIRRQPLSIDSPDGRYFGLSGASYLAYLRLPARLTDQVVRFEAPYVRLAERDVLVDAQGIWLQDYFGGASQPGNETFMLVSVVDVLGGQVAPEIFNDKIVIVGLMNSQGAIDQYPVPSARAGELMAGMEIQANAIESLLQDRVLVNLPDFLQGGFVVMLALASSFLYVYPRWQIKLLLVGAMVILVILIGLLVYNVSGVIVSLFYPLLAVSTPAILLIGQDLNREILRRQRSDFLLQSVVSVSEQRLALSRIVPLVIADIQRILPDVAGGLWLVPLESGQLRTTLYQSWGNMPTDKALKPLDLLTLKAPNEVAGIRYFPMQSQGRLIGVLGLYGDISLRQELLLVDMARQIAPVIDAAQLYSLADRQRALLQSVLSQSPSPVVALDENGFISLQNDFFSNLAPDIVEANFRDWLKQVVDADDVVTRVLTALVNQEAFRQEIAFDNHFFILQAAPLHTDIRWVIVFYDVTDLTTLNQLKTRMIRMASHDLKNPLARINGYIQLLEMSEQLTAEDNEFIGRVKEASEEMLQLINDILNLERTQSGNITHERVEMRTIVQQIYLRHEPEARLKNQSYHLHVPDTLIFTEGDFNQLSQVISNLINNAIKYTPEGKAIHISLAKDDAKSQLRFEVRDEGYGIAEEAQAKLFTEFYRVRTQETIHITGTGLGLSLVKAVVDAHKGRVGVISEEGRGSTFYVELPLHTDQTSPIDYNYFWGNQ